MKSIEEFIAEYRDKFCWVESDEGAVYSDIGKEEEIKFIRTYLNQMLDELEMEEKEIPIEPPKLTEKWIDVSIKANKFHGYNQAVREQNQKIKKIKEEK